MIFPLNINIIFLPAYYYNMISLQTFFDIILDTRAFNEFLRALTGVL